MGREVCCIKLILRLFRFADVKDSKQEPIVRTTIMRNRRLYDEKEDLIALGLTDEQADKVIAGFGTMVPKSRLDDKINEVKDLTTQLKERDTQLNDLKRMDAAGLQTKIEELQQQNETDKAEYEAKIKDTQLKSALKLALASKVHDTDLVTGLIDKSAIELDEEGNVKKA